MRSSGCFQHWYVGDKKTIQPQNSVPITPSKNYVITLFPLPTVAIFCLKRTWSDSVKENLKCFLFSQEDAQVQNRWRYRVKGQPTGLERWPINRPTLYVSNRSITHSWMQKSITAVTWVLCKKISGFVIVFNLMYCYWFLHDNKLHQNYLQKEQL